MTAPHLVPCLVTLRAEFNAVAPGRDKGADGWIGDPAHQARTSDHNPDAQGRVLAVDIDSTGPWPVSFDDLVEKCRGDDRLEYIIWNRRIASRDQGWTWRTYTGTSDPHTGHAHFSARHDHTGNNSTASWGLETGMLPISKGASSEDVRLCQMMLNDLLDAPAFAGQWAKVTADGDYGDATQTAVNAYRKHYGQGPNDGITAWQFFCMMRDMAGVRAGKDGASGAPGKDGAPGAPGKDGQLTGALNVTGGQLTVEPA
jgi:hypothetical protein